MREFGAITEPQFSPSLSSHTPFRHASRPNKAFSIQWHSCWCFGCTLIPAVALYICCFCWYYILLLLLFFVLISGVILFDAYLHLSNVTPSHHPSKGKMIWTDQDFSFSPILLFFFSGTSFEGQSVSCQGKEKGSCEIRGQWEWQKMIPERRSRTTRHSYDGRRKKK